MNIFLDTSTLVKLYHSEIGTKDIDSFFKDNPIDKIYLSEITKIEFDSAIWKKVRTTEMKQQTAEGLIKSFEEDYNKYTFIDDKVAIKNKSKELITKYRVEGLRTLDAIQLATANSIKAKADLYKSSDKLLTELFEKEGLPVK